jgi:hypothetical protein
MEVDTGRATPVTNILDLPPDLLEEMNQTAAVLKGGDLLVDDDGNTRRSAEEPGEVVEAPGFRGVRMQGLPCPGSAGGLPQG